MSTPLLRVLLLAWLWSAALVAAAQGSPAIVPTTLSGVLSVESAAASFPAESTPRTVTLPDPWSQSRPDAAGPVWYRGQFAMPERALGEGVWALSLERVCTTVTVVLNGHRIHQPAGALASGSANCNQPLLVPLPTPLLQVGRNVLDVQLVGRPLERVASPWRAAGLSPWVIDRHADLVSSHERQRLWQAGVPLGLAMALVAVGAFTFWMGWRGPRRDSYLVYFGALSGALALAQTPAWLPAFPFGDGTTEFLLATLMPVMTWAAVQFLLRYAGQRIRAADYVLPVQCLLMPLSLLVAGPAHLHLAVQIWSSLFLVEVLAAAGRHLWAQWSTSQAGFWAMALLLLVAGLAEILAYAGVHMSQPLLVTVGQAVLPSILVLVGLRLIQQRGRALETAEASRALLEQRVAEVKAEIEANYRQLSELRVVQVTDRERKRIAADLHDDLGAKLLTIVHTSESERISTLAREALEEMRLSVRGLTGKPVRLEDALGDWRAEVISRLGQAGIEAVWNMPTEDLPHTLPARAFVQTTRIIRESVNNIIKHSGASQCAVRCNVADGDFQLVIQDNGKGISVEVDGRLDRGHGLSSMKGRAKQLQGQCLVESGPGYGTVIRLTIPLEPATTAA